MKSVADALRAESRARGTALGVTARVRRVLELGDADARSACLESLLQ